MILESNENTSVFFWKNSHLIWFKIISYSKIPLIFRFTKVSLDNVLLYSFHSFLLTFSFESAPNSFASLITPFAFLLTLTASLVLSTLLVHAFFASLTDSNFFQILMKVMILPVCLEISKIYLSFWWRHLAQAHLFCLFYFVACFNLCRKFLS